MIRALVVDDSVVVRSVVTRLLSASSDIRVVGTAVDGQDAQDKVARLEPDLVTMDVEMPRMDGITAVKELRRSGHAMPIIMLSTLTERGARATIDALTAGASDYVAKPSNSASLHDSMEQLAGELLPKIHTLVSPPPSTAARTQAGTQAASSAPLPSLSQVQMALVGSSTGGPAALATIVSSLTRPPAVPVLVTQHMPAMFTRQLAERLDRAGRARVVEAQDGDPLEPGTIYIAPGGRHLEVEDTKRSWRARLSDASPVNYCRPSVDVMAYSAARAVGAKNLLVVMLTGMGSDGSRASADISRAGGSVIAQDKATSVVWGMPGATVAAGAVTTVLPVDKIGPAVERAMEGKL